MTDFYKPLQLPNTKLITAAKQIVQTLQKKGYIAYFVGGSVRDLLIGKSHIEEVDIVTNAMPEEIMNLFPYHKSVGAHFGVILVSIQISLDKEKMESATPIKTNQIYTFDVATFRKDGKYNDGRRPNKVEFTDAKEDVKRRDFTINGMFFDPISEKIIDFVGGLRDINNKVIDTIGDPHERFGEDKLRMLRGIRFLAQLSQYNFTIAHRVLDTITQQSYTLNIVSKERIREELIKIIQYSKTSKEIELLFKTGLSSSIFPISQPTIKALELFKNVLNSSIPFCLKYLTIVYDQIPLQNMLSRLKQIFLFTSEELSIAKNLIFWFKNIDDWKNMEVYAKKRSLRNLYIYDILSFLEFYIPIYLPQKQNIFLDIKEYYQAEKNNLYPVLFIDGNILIQKGLKPSSYFKTILERIENEQLQGNIKTKTQALVYLDDILAKNNGDHH